MGKRNFLFRGITRCEPNFMFHVKHSGSENGASFLSAVHKCGIFIHAHGPYSMAPAYTPPVKTYGLAIMSLCGSCQSAPNIQTPVYFGMWMVRVISLSVSSRPQRASTPADCITARLFFTVLRNSRTSWNR